jgi:hypothetical protein
MQAKDNFAEMTIADSQLRVLQSEIVKQDFNDVM